MHAGLLWFRRWWTSRSLVAAPGRPAAPWYTDHQVLIVSLLVVGIFVIGTSASAELGVKDGTSFILNTIASILSIIIDFMGSLILLLVSILINFASYNEFVHAQPVEIGWVLMRDVANMFFIVVLLVSAFSTIIGYHEFHYTKVLPKLLLYAVLINFSKTLIGLLIDFSQVLMLTFVNAFRQAAGGNFISALKLSRITSFSREAEPGGADLEVASGLIPASILGIVMLGISITLLVIMIGFVIFRIIGLWMLLIISPLAFFALALPSKMSKAMSVFTGSFWSRLSDLLIGGPVMAFFLWLSLAVVQGDGTPFAALYPESRETTSAAEFVTQVGTASEIATFIVAIALMLSGVEFAIKTSGAISPALGSFAKSVAAGGGPAVLLARGAARIGRKTASFGFEGVDRVADVRGALGRGGLAVSSRLGGVGAATFAGLAGYKAGKIKARGAELNKVTAGLDSATRTDYLRGLAASPFSGKDGTAATLALGMEAISPASLKLRTNALMKQAEGRADLTTPAQKKAWAEYTAYQQAAQEIKAGKELAEKIGDEDKVAKFKEAVAKNPTLGGDWASFAAVKGSSMEDPKAFMKGISTDAMKDSRTFLAAASALELLDEDGGWIEAGHSQYEEKKHKERMELLLSGQDRGGYAKQHMADLGGNREAILAQLALIDGKADAKQTALAKETQRFAAREKGMGSIQVNNANPINVAQAFTVRNEGEIEAQQKRLSEFSRQNIAGDSDQAVAAKVAMIGAGATLAEAFKYNVGGGAFEDPTSRVAFEKAMSSTDANLKAGKALDIVEGLDTASLASNAGNYNEARAVVASQISTEALRKSFEKAMETGNKAAQRRIGELVDIIAKEGRRVRTVANNAKIEDKDLVEVAANPSSVSSQAIIQRMEKAGIVNPVIAAKAVDKSMTIETTAQLRAMRRGVGSGQNATVIKKGKTLSERRQEGRDKRTARNVEKMEKKLGGGS